MKKIGIYRTVYPLVSETFITQQAGTLTKYLPMIITRTKTGDIPFDYATFDTSTVGKINKFLFSLTRSAFFWNIDNRLKELVLIHAHFGPDGLYALSLAKKLNIPLIVTFHGFDCTSSKQSLWRSGKPSNFHFLLFKKKLIQEADVFIAVSKFIKNVLLKNGFPEEKIIQHYIGVDTDLFSPCNKKKPERYILCVGRHTEVKGIDTLLVAFSLLKEKHPDIFLVQVGDGSLTATLTTLAESLGIRQRVRFLGAQPHRRVLELMQGAEIFSLPSQTASSLAAEALGIVFNEASSCGLPIVATRHGGIPEAVLDGKTGFLVQEKDSTALAERLDSLLSHPETARQMGQRGREYVCKQFDIQKQTRLLEQIYDKILGA